MLRQSLIDFIDARMERATADRDRYEANPLLTETTRPLTPMEDAVYFAAYAAGEIGALSTVKLEAKAHEPMRLWRCQVNAWHTTPDGTTGAGVTTFHLDGNALGLMSEQSARIAARGIVDPFHLLGENLSIDVIEVT